MRFTLLASAIALGFTATAAYAGEGAGDPFPFRAPGITTTVTGTKLLADQPDNPFGYKAPGQVVTPAQSGAMMASSGSEGPVQSYNSLPDGFTNQDTAFAQTHTSSPSATAQAGRAGRAGTRG